MASTAMESAASSDIAIYIDPPSRHFLDDRLFSYQGILGDNLMAPYGELRRICAERGIPIHTADLLPGREDRRTKLYMSFGILDNYRRLSRRPDVIVSSFFAMECPIVDPGQYRRLRDARHYFRHILSWSDSESLAPFIGERIGVETFHWPQSYNRVHENYWARTDREFLMMMNSNKLPALYRNELYTERMRAVEFFSRTGEIDLYGREWDMPSIRMGRSRIPYTFRKWRRDIQRQWEKLFPDPLLVAARKVYRGPAESKSAVLSNYRFSLCFENMILKGWVTEKIFDCFFAGTVPIYLGSPDIETRIPESCYIDMRKFSDYPALRDYLRSLTPEDIQRYKENARAFLESPDFRPYSKESFVARIIAIIESDTGATLR